jgi:F-type H+-transporting ATPase subunit a
MSVVAWLAPLQEAAQEGVGARPDLAGMLMEHLSDGHEIEFELLGRGFVWHLPRWAPVHLGPLTLDLSPTRHVVFLILAAVVLTVVFLTVGSVMRRRYHDRAPTGFTNAMEAMVLFFRDEVVRRNIGHGADGYTSFILTLFFFILTMNLFGLIPFASRPTGNLAVTGGLALTTFIVTEITGIRELGFSGYMKTIFYAPPGLSGVGKVLMLVIMTPVELLGKLTKPFALTVRLFANMMAGEALVLSLLGLIFLFANLAIGKFFIAGASFTMVVGIMVLELFVAFLQAFIFAMLSAVFIGLIRHAH